jgi:NADP-reducing hydrogenase subunit HndB
MGKITIDDLAKIRKKYQHTLTVRQNTSRVVVNVHMGTCGINAGAREILKVVMREIENRNLNDVIVTNSGCAGVCNQEPMLTVETVDGVPSVKYGLMTPDKVKKIFDSHILKGQVVKEYLLASGSGKTQ